MYTVTFKLDGAVTSTQKVNYGETITSNDPKQDNDVFVGWFKEGNNQKVDNRTVIMENMTLEARFMKTITIGGQIWLDRNLGATKVASNVTDTGIDVCGNYYQWGRGNDGHEIYNSTTSLTQIPWNATSSEFITGVTTWISGNNPVGKTYNTMNNPCPTGFRVPTKADFQTLSTAVGGEKGKYHEAFFDELKMVKCGRRNNVNAQYANLGIDGYYWSTDKNANINMVSNFLSFNNNSVTPENMIYSALGFSVRCININK